MSLNRGDSTDLLLGAPPPFDAGLLPQPPIPDFGESASETSPTWLASNLTAFPAFGEPVSQSAVDYVESFKLPVDPLAAEELELNELLAELKRRKVELDSREALLRAEEAEFRQLIAIQSQQKVLVALFPYTSSGRRNGRGEVDLSFAQGDQFSLLASREQGWCLVQRKSPPHDKGVIPERYCEEAKVALNRCSATPSRQGEGNSILPPVTPPSTIEHAQSTHTQHSPEPPSTAVPGGSDLRPSDQAHSKRKGMFGLFKSTSPRSGSTSTAAPKVAHRPAAQSPDRPMLVGGANSSPTGMKQQQGQSDVPKSNGSGVMVSAAVARPVRAGIPKRPSLQIGGLAHARPRLKIATVPKQPMSSGGAQVALADQSALDPSWFFGDISRVDAEKLLSTTSVQSFLVRTSSQPGYYALSRWHLPQRKFMHLLVAPVTASAFQLQDCKDKTVYPSIAEAIARSPELIGFTPVGRR